MFKPHVQARGLRLVKRLAPFLFAVGLAFSPLTGCYAHAYPDGVYVSGGGGYYGGGGYRYRRGYRDYGHRSYRRGPDHYYRGDRYYRSDYRRHDHHRHYHDRW